MAATPDIKSEDFYRVRGVDQGATEKEIAKAYRKLALKHHPDKNQADKERAEAQFKKLTEAYETLQDQEKRRTYDQAEETATPPEWSTHESPDPSAGTTPTQSTSSPSCLLPASASAAGGLGAASNASTGFCWDNGGCWGRAGHNYGKASCKGCFSEVTDQVFIEDLLGAFTQEQMATIFGAYGIVLKSKLLTPAASSGMRAAIIEFSSVDEAKWIVENLNGDIPEGMDAPIKVRYIRNRMGTATTVAWGASPYGENGKGDLVADVTEEEMSAVFGAYGNITGSKLLAPNSNGKRTSIIQYATAVEAKWIVEHLDGKIPQGMNGPVKIGYEMDKEPVAIAPAFAAWSRSNLSNTGGKGGKGAKNGKAVSKCNASFLVKGLYESGALPGGSGVGSEETAVIISGVPGDTTDLHLYQMFSVFGSIPPKGVRAMLNDDGVCTGIGFVNFLDGASVDNATSTLNGTRMPDGSENAEATFKRITEAYETLEDQEKQRTYDQACLPARDVRQLCRWKRQL